MIDSLGLEKINQISVDLGFREYTAGTGNTLDLFCITAALMVGTAGLPHVIVRFFTVKSVKAVRKSAFWTLSFIAIIYLTAPALGMFARTNFIEEINEKKYKNAPEWFNKITNEYLLLDMHGYQEDKVNIKKGRKEYPIYAYSIC